MKHWGTKRVSRRPLTALAVISLLTAGLTGNALGQQPVSGSGEWYYQIGGAEPISRAPNALHTPFTISGGASLRLPRACGQLDPVISVSNILDDIKKGIDQFEDAMVLAANSAIAALPAIILQRANPGLYDHFQSAVLNAKARVDIAIKSCQQMVDDAAKGENPFKDWVRISRINTLGRQLDTAGNDPVTAHETVETTNGDEGVPWLGGDAGGDGQEPIRVVYDTTRAGYNVTLNRDADATGAPPAASTPPRLVELWSSPEEAAQWAVEVLGDLQIRTCQGCTPSTDPGTGLLPKYESERELVAPLIADLVASITDPTLTNLRQVSAPSVIVSRQVIEAMQGMLDPQEQALVIGRLSSEVATARIAERALTIRRLMLTGQRVPEIAANAPAQESHSRSIAEIQREIDNFLYETEVRQKLVSRTAKLVLEREETRRLSSMTRPATRDQDPQPLRGGKVNP